MEDYIKKKITWINLSQTSIEFIGLLFVDCKNYFLNSGRYEQHDDDDDNARWMIFCCGYKKLIKQKIIPATPYKTIKQ